MCTFIEFICMLFYRNACKMLPNICNILYIKFNVTSKPLCSGEISEKSGEDEEEEEDANVLYLATPEGGPLIVAALDNSGTEV